MNYHVYIPYMLRDRKAVITSPSGSVPVSSLLFHSGYTLLVTAMGYHTVCNIRSFG